jgi:hypothetical protein
MRKPSPAMIVALLGVFIGLGGVGVAATGGTFILGQPNTADDTTSLNSGVTTGPTLELSNGGNRPAARFRAAPGVQPFVVDSPTKITNLNADKLDGLSSESFTQGGGRLYSAHRDGVALGSQGTLLDIPGVTTLRYRCGDPTYGNVALIFVSSITNLTLVGEVATSRPPPDDLWTGYLIAGSGFYGGTLMEHLMGSRPFNRMTFEPAVLVDARVAGHWRQPTNKCNFEAVAEVFG